MNWKFWQKDKTGADGKPSAKETKPKDLPQSVGKHMVVQMAYDPDWVWALKVVTKEREGKKGIRDYRVFDPAAAALKKIKITGFSSLEGHPDLVLFDGWYDKNSDAHEINDHSKSIQKGSAA